MKLRPYQSSDYDEIRTWTSDERAHVMWCAGRFPYPMTREGFEDQLAFLTQRSGDRFFTAVGEGGEVIGFFGLMIKPDVRKALLKFVIVSPEYRGKGYGHEMISLAVVIIFEKEDVDSVQLTVFSSNPAAFHCYSAAGFVEESRSERDFEYRDECWDRCHMAIQRH